MKSKKIQNRAPLIKISSHLLLVTLPCYLIMACASPRKLLRKEKGCIIKTEIQILDDSEIKYSIKIDWRPESTDVKIRLTKDIFCSKKEQDIHKVNKIYKVYKPLYADREKVTLGDQLGDLLFIRPSVAAFGALFLLPILTPKKYFSYIFARPLGYDDKSPYEETEPAKEETIKSEPRLSSGVCNSYPLMNEEVFVIIRQNNFQEEYALTTDIEGEAYINFNSLKWLYKKDALKVDASTNIDNHKLNSSIEILPADLANLSIPEDPPIPTPMALHYYAEGKICYEEDRLEEAIALFKKAIEEFPGFPEAHKDLGLAYGRTRRFDEAIYHLSECIKLDPVQKDAEEIERIIEALRIKPSVQQR